MGLGLAICRQIVEHHGGELVAFSDGNSGAQFQLVLPVRQNKSAISGSSPLQPQAILASGALIRAKALSFGWRLLVDPERQPAAGAAHARAEEHCRVWQ